MRSHFCGNLPNKHSTTLLYIVTWVGPCESLNPDRWEITPKMHLKTIFIDFWKIRKIHFESWNPAVAWNSGHFTWVRLQQPQEQRYPFLTMPAVFSCVQAKVWLPVLGSFNVHTDVNACDCTRGLYGHRKRVGTKSWLVEKSLGAPGNRTCLSGVPVRRSTNRATSPRLSLVLCGDSLS